MNNVSNCSNFPDCRACTKENQCAWCASEGVCIGVNDAFSRGCHGLLFDPPCPVEFLSGI